MKKNITYVFQTLFLLLFVISGQAISGETVTYYHMDNLGSPVAASDEAGNLKWSEQYQPYGGRILKEGDDQNDIWFTGKPEEIGLSYMGARWYDAELGRFLAIDPVGFHEGNPQSFNRYAYANNNPYRYVDPDGNIPLDTVLDAAFVLYDIGKMGVGYLTGNTMLMQEAAIDLASDTLALVTPYVPAGSSRIARALDNAGDVTKKALPEHTKHSLNQKINRQVKTSDELDAIRNPLDKRPVKYDSQGRPSQRSVGEKAEVAINPDTNKIVSVNPTSSKKAARFKRRNERNQ